MSALKGKFGPQWLLTTLLGVANGVAQLDSSGKLPLAQLPSGIAGGLSFKGSYDASTPLPSSPSNGDLYMVSVAGNAGGNFTSPPLAVGDYVFYSSSASAWEPVYAPKNSDALSEGSTNLFFTAARAQAAAVQNSLAASTTIAPSASAVNTALSLKQGAYTRNKERFTLTSTDITNGYVILSQLALAKSITAGVQGLGLLEEQTVSSTGDYAVTTDSGTSHSKITWLNDLASAGATPLAAGDVIYFQYSY